MRQYLIAIALAAAAFMPSGSAEEAAPYKVLKSARVGGEGGWDYIYADAAARRLYIPRGATRAMEATDTTPAVPAAPARLTIYNLDSLAPAGEVADVGGNGTAVDPTLSRRASRQKKTDRRVDAGSGQPLAPAA